MKLVSSGNQRPHSRFPPSSKPSRAKEDRDVGFLLMLSLAFASRVGRTLDRRRKPDVFSLTSLVVVTLFFQGSFSVNCISLNFNPLIIGSLCLRSFGKHNIVLTGIYHYLTILEAWKTSRATHKEEQAFLITSDSGYCRPCFQDGSVWSTSIPCM